jgi:hypothetical protein
VPFAEPDLHKEGITNKKIMIEISKGSHPPNAGSYGHTIVVVVITVFDC